MSKPLDPKTKALIDQAVAAVRSRGEKPSVTRVGTEISGNSNWFYYHSRGAELAYVRGLLITFQTDDDAAFMARVRAVAEELSATGQRITLTNVALALGTSRQFFCHPHQKGFRFRKQVRELLWTLREQRKEREAQGQGRIRRRPRLQPPTWERKANPAEPRQEKPAAPAAGPSPAAPVGPSSQDADAILAHLRVKGRMNSRRVALALGYDLHPSGQSRTPMPPERLVALLKKMQTAGLIAWSEAHQAWELPGFSAGRQRPQPDHQAGLTVTRVLPSWEPSEWQQRREQAAKAKSAAWDADLQARKEAAKSWGKRLKGRPSKGGQQAG